MPVQTALHGSHGGGALRSRWCWVVNVTLDQPPLTTEQPAVARPISPEVTMKLLGVDFFVMSSPMIRN